MVADELMLKLGIDQSQVAPGLEDFKRKVANAAGVGQKSFLNVESRAASFKKLLRELETQSGGFGTALRFALDPVVGIMTTGILLIKKFADAEKEAAENAEKLGRALAGQQVSAIEARYSEDPQAFRRRLAAQDAKKQAEKSVEDFYPEAKATARRFFTETQLGTWGFESSELFTSKLREVAFGMRESAVRRYEEMLKTEKQARDENAEVEELRETIQNEIAAANAKKEEKDRLDKDQLAAQKELVAAMERETDAAVKAAERQQQGVQSYAERFKPDVETLAKQGRWVKHRGRWVWQASGLAEQAQYIQWLEAGAREQFAAGDVAGANETLFGKGGAAELRGQLEDKQIIPRDLTRKIESAFLQNGALKAYIEDINPNATE